MNWQLVAFLALTLHQIVANTTYIAVYVLGSDWRRDPVGRHLLYWPLATTAVELSWVLLLVIRWPWFAYVLLGAQLLVGVLTWHRVVLVLRRQRR